MSHHTLCLQESENAHTRISITDTAWEVVATHQPPHPESAPEETATCIHWWAVVADHEY